MSEFTVRLEDKVYGRVVLTEVNAASATAAAAQAAASPGISGDVSTFEGGAVVDQAALLSHSGNDVNGNPLVSPTSLPLNPN